VFYRNGWTGRAGFWHGDFFRPILHCVVRKIRYLQNKGTLLWICTLNSGFKKFRHGTSIVETCYQLSSTKADAISAMNRTAVGQPACNTSDAQLLVYNSYRQALSTAQFRRAGLLATADTCLYTEGDSDLISLQMRRFAKLLSKLVITRKNALPSLPTLNPDCNCP